MTDRELRVVRVILKRLLDLYPSTVSPELVLGTSEARLRCPPGRNGYDGGLREVDRHRGREDAHGKAHDE